MISTATGITTLVSTGISTAIAWLVGILNRTWVGAGHTFHFDAVAVVAGDDHCRVLQFLLQVGGRREYDTARLDETSLHVVDVLHGLRRQAEAHGSQTGQRHAVALGRPCLDDTPGSIPAGLHHALAHATAQGSLTDYFLSSQCLVEFWLHHIAIELAIAQLELTLLSFNLNTHNV